MSSQRPTSLRFPNFETLKFFAERFPEVDVSATEAFISTLKVALKFVSVTEAYLASKDLSHARMMILMFLLHADGRKVTPGEIAEHLNVTRATVTGILDTLVGQTWVDRRPDPDDRRSVIVVLTAAGKKKLKDMLPGHYTRIARMMAGFSEADRRAIKRLMKQFGESLDELT